MTGQEFLNAVANGKEDILRVLQALLAETRRAICIIGGLAVNAYAEPVVSLDLDIVVATALVDRLCQAAQQAGLKTEQFEHSVNLSSPSSDLRVQLQSDPRYQEFIGRASERAVLGYRLIVAALEDVLAGKVWAYSDPTRRKSKRQKDLADILRLVEAHPHLKELPDDLRPLVD